jgi:hypothetical protein
MLEFEEFPTCKSNKLLLHNDGFWKQVFHKLYNFHLKEEDAT